jgi:hypothetical protein
VSRPPHPQIDVSAPHVLREYALIADGQRAALIGPRGDIGWMCAPAWDSGSIFSSLIGGRGEYGVTPRVPYVWGGWYEDATLIWRSRWITHEGAVECREALAYPGDAERAVVLRRVIAADCAARVDVLLCPRADYDQQAVHRWRCVDGVWTGQAGGLRLRWSGAADAKPVGGGALMLSLDVPAGEHHDLVLEISAGELPDRPQPAEAAWHDTETAWHDARPAFPAVRGPVDSAHHYAVLLGLTGPGGTVAAATTSLPERSGAGRNYDYRFVWIRDQCFVGQAAAASGAQRLLASSVDTVARLMTEHGARLAPAYTVGGESVPMPAHLDLPGYPGGQDIVGNRVRDQFQLDVFGEALLVFAAAARAECLDSDGWRAAETAAQAAAQLWQRPDAGIWEIDERPWAHSRLIVAAGLRAIAGVAPAGQGAEWVSLADRIVSDTARTSLHPDGRWQRAPDDPAGDAALLLPGLRGAVPADDPRTAATLDGYLRELTVDGYAYRFRHDDRPLHEAEGSFLMCGFATALALQQQGSRDAAVGWYERTSAACGPPQLFSEEYDSHQHQMRGNLPQAFVHALAIECAATLGND